MGDEGLVRGAPTGVGAPERVVCVGRGDRSLVPSVPCLSGLGTADGPGTFLSYQMAAVQGGASSLPRCWSWWSGGRARHRAIPVWLWANEVVFLLDRAYFDTWRLRALAGYGISVLCCEGRSAMFDLIAELVVATAVVYGLGIIFR